MGYQHLEEQHFMLAQKLVFTIFLIMEKKLLIMKRLLLVIN